ncbi:MAG: sigma factor-like helix-turn-helix DNA-binding protein [Nanoarchaeota archaeon]
MKKYMLEFNISSKTGEKHEIIYGYMERNNLNFDSLSSDIGICKLTLWKIVNFRWIPRKHRYSKKTIKKLVDYFGCSEEELFPGEFNQAIKDNIEFAQLMQDTDINKKKINLEFHPFYAFKHIGYKADQENVIFDKERRKIINNSLKNLKPLERRVIKKIYELDSRGEGCTLEEVGKEINHTRGGASYIKQKALRKLRHPAIKRKLKEVY